MFFEAYVIPVPNKLKHRITERLTMLYDTLSTGAANGNPAFQKIVDEGHLAHNEEPVWNGV
ncbi:hypothetical protein AR543_18700 [Paenibacillus bovis]|uniref:Uncharacterized protein n=1 Tax=Paenibacillus bovis TaxID=1616788 RepID=A0A172ZKA0_9BACL|nr:hypothetical protein AR543_18700 [Paenibacillus bovis]